MAWGGESKIASDTLGNDNFLQKTRLFLRDLVLVLLVIYYLSSVSLNHLTPRIPKYDLSKDRAGNWKVVVILVHIYTLSN